MKHIKTSKENQNKINIHSFCLKQKLILTDNLDPEKHAYWCYIYLFFYLFKTVPEFIKKSR